MMYPRKYLFMAFAFVVSAAFGASVGAPSASAAESCGEPDAVVCSYIPSGCAQGQACNQTWCYTIMCLPDQTGPGSRCWRCGGA
jgi:hypothetical protein